MLEQPWRFSGCHWLTAVAMVTHAGIASFPGIRTVAGTKPGESVSPFRPDTTRRMGKPRADVTFLQLMPASTPTKKGLGRAHNDMQYTAYICNFTL